MFTPLGLQISKSLLLPSAAVYLSKTILPLDLTGDITIFELLKDIYRQFKAMLVPELEPGKVYLTSVDGYFLPPNCIVKQLGIFEMVLTSSQDLTKNTNPPMKADLFAIQRKRDIKAEEKQVKTQQTIQKQAVPQKVENKIIDRESIPQTQPKKSSNAPSAIIPKKKIVAKSSSSSQSSEEEESSSSEESSSEPSKSDQSLLKQQISRPQAPQKQSVVQNEVKLSPFDQFTSKWLGKTQDGQVADKPYLDKFLNYKKQEPAQQTNDEYFNLLNNKNMSVILQKRNFFAVTNRGESFSPLLNRICIFSVTQLDPVSMVPTVTPLRVGVIQENGIKLRHDFELTGEEASTLEEQMGETYSKGLYKLSFSQFVELWVRKDGLPSDVITKFTAEVSAPAQPSEFKQTPQPKQQQQSSQQQVQNAIRRQLEYYFSDKNYKRDHFLLRLAAKDQQSFVDINELLQFNKMKQIGATLDNVRDALQHYQAKSFEFVQDKIRQKSAMVSHEQLLKEVTDSLWD